MRSNERCTPARPAAADRGAGVRELQLRLGLPLPVQCPAHTLWYDHGWADEELPEEYLFDLLFDPNEVNNLAASPSHVDTLEDMRSRLDTWMQQTSDPILGSSLAELPGIVATPQKAYHPDGRIT